MRSVESVMEDWVDVALSTSFPEEEVDFSVFGSTISIFTSKPGLLIGYHGATIAKYSKILGEECEIHEIKFVDKTSWRRVRRCT